MTLLKVFGLLNGGFYVVYGLFGAFLPKSMLKLMGWTPNLLGLHQIRAVSMAMAAMGAVIVLTALRAADLVPLTLALILLTLGFLTGRLLGLLLDGPGPRQSYVEIAIEIAVVLIAVILLKRAGG